MITEEQALALIRQYLEDSQDEQRRADATAAIQLLQDRATSLATLEKHFNAFTGRDRFWLYTLAALLLEGSEARSRFYAERLPLEDDPICQQVIVRFQKYPG